MTFILIITKKQMICRVYYQDKINGKSDYIETVGPNENLLEIYDYLDQTGKKFLYTTYITDGSEKKTSCNMTEHQDKSN